MSIVASSLKNRYNSKTCVLSGVSIKELNHWNKILQMGNIQVTLLVNLIVQAELINFALIKR